MSDPVMRRVRRAPHAFVHWQGGARVVASARRAQGLPASALVLEVLDALDTWVSEDALAAALDIDREPLADLLDGLIAHELVEVATGASTDEDTTPRVPWTDWSAAAHLFHLGTRDVPFTRTTSRSTHPEGRPTPVLDLRGDADVPLPLPRLAGTLRDALRVRRTHRRFATQPLSHQDVGTLLGVTFGVQVWAATEEGPLALKTSPSGGARHSLEAFVWIRRVDGIDAGLYHYRPDVHALTTLAGRTPPEHVTRWLPTQDAYEGAAMVVVLAPVLARVAWRYRHARALRVVLIEAGHLGQTFCLVAASLGLAPFCTAALADSRVEADLGLDRDAMPAVYALGTGVPVSGAWQPHPDQPAPVLTRTPLGDALDALTSSTDPA